MDPVPKQFSYFYIVQALILCVIGTLYHTEDIPGPDGCTLYFRAYSQNETEQHYLSKLKQNDDKLLALRNQLTQLIIERKQIKNELSKLNPDLLHKPTDIVEDQDMNHTNGTLIQWKDGQIIHYSHQRIPSAEPTNNPTLNPTLSPTKPPTDSPTNFPTLSPTMQPTKQPTNRPTRFPTLKPSKTPTLNPTQKPTKSPTPQWDVTHITTPIKSKKKKKKKKFLADTSKKDDEILLKHRLKYQNLSQAGPESSTQLITNIIEIHEITPNDPQSFKDYTLEKINGNEYDYIITKYSNENFVTNSSVKIDWYYKIVDKVYDSITAVYSLLLIGGASIDNLLRFGDDIDEFYHLCKELETNSNQSFCITLNNRTSLQMKNAVMRMKASSERNAKFLALELCGAFFFSVHDLKVLRARQFTNNSAKEWDHRRDLLQKVINTSIQAAELDTYDTIIGIELKEYVATQGENYLPAVNLLNELVDEVNMYKDGVTISNLLYQWRLTRNDTRKYRICVIVPPQNVLFFDNWDDTLTHVHTVNMAAKGRRNQKTKRTKVKVKEVSF